MGKFDWKLLFSWIGLLFIALTFWYGLYKGGQYLYCEFIKEKPVSNQQLMDWHKYPF